MEKFKDKAAVERTQQFLDKLARRAWEPFHNNKSGFAENTLANAPYYDQHDKPLTKLWQVLSGAMGSFCAAIKTGEAVLPPAVVRTSAPYGADIGADPSWAPFEYEEVCDIVASDAFTSVADATVKATAHLAPLTSSTQGHGRYAFRGQENITWPLISRKGREVRTLLEKDQWAVPTNPGRVTSVETDALSAFKSSWPPDDVDKLDNIDLLPADDAAWWGRMQHYDTGAGTRLVDVTSSLFFGLLFACVRWSDGTIADATDDEDGIVYVFYESGNYQVDDFALRAPANTTDFFNSQYHGVGYMAFNPPHNERSKAQGGCYLWWPRFWEPRTEDLHYFRIPKEAKRRIARELLAFGVGPKEAVRGRKGLENESRLRADLGMPTWNPAP